MYRLGIDLGGTNIVAGVVDENYKIVGIGKRKTNLPRPAKEIIDDVVLAVNDAVCNAGITITEICSMGIGSPGMIDPIKGEVCYANNLGFKNVPLAKELQERLGVKCYIENDANAAAYGEYIAGAGKGTDNFIAITLGTGVGGGIIIDGKIYSGSNFTGAEIGHITMNMDGELCSCGKKGCFEVYASASALIYQTKLAMIKDESSVMWQLINGDIRSVDGKTAFDGMRQGDKTATEVVNRYLEYLAKGISTVITIFQPDMICIGGGISKEGDALLLPVKKIIEKDNFVSNVEKKTQIIIAKLGNDAGIIGAAYLANLYN